MVTKKRVSHSKRQQTAGGRVSLTLAILSVILFLVTILISVLKRGESGSIVGGVGMISMALSIYGFYVGMRSFSERNRKTTYSLVGSTICGFLMVGWLALFLMGTG